MIKQQTINISDNKKSVIDSEKIKRLQRDSTNILGKSVKINLKKYWIYWIYRILTSSIRKMTKNCMEQ